MMTKTKPSVPKDSNCKAQRVGRKAANTACPSKGGMGMKLKIDNPKFNNKTRIVSSKKIRKKPDCGKFSFRNRPSRSVAHKANNKLDNGPAIDMNIKDFLRSPQSRVEFTGTGLA